MYINYCYHIINSMHIVQKNLDICTLDKYYNIMYINKIGKDIFKEEELVLRYRLLLNIHNIIKEFEQYKKLLKESVKFFYMQIGMISLKY